MQLVENSGEEGAVYLNEVMEASQTSGFNAVTGKVEDLIEAQVIDPTNVVKGCLIHAVSGAKIVLTSEALIADAPEEGLVLKRSR